MRICVHKATKHILEMQGGGEVERLTKDQFNETIKASNPEATYVQYLSDCDALEAMRFNTLKQNAINGGYAEADIEVKWVDEAGYEAAKAEDPQWIVEQQAAADKTAAQAAKAQAFLDNLPSWAIVDKAVTDISDLPSAKAFIRKLARVVYWDVRNQAD